MTEIWKSVIGYENFYEVSNLGRVRSLSRKVSTKFGQRTVKGRILTQMTMPKGYKYVNLSKEGKTQVLNGL